MPKVFALLLLSAAMGCQSHFIYYPTKGSESSLLLEAEHSGMRAWKNDAGEIIGWRPVKEHGSSRFLVFHGNAGYALHRTYYGQALSGLANGFDVFIFEYPGYGARPGRPSEAAIYEAAEDALKLLFKEDDKPLYLAGESLGSGVASQMAARFPERIAGLLLVTPFTNLKDVARSHFPGFLVNLILSERYDNEKALKTYTGPIAVLLAEHDEVVPADLGRSLYDGYKGPKKIWIQKGRTHNTLDLSAGAPWWSELAKFLAAESG